MGSTAALDQDEMTVFVTGFGPFKEQFPQNPSWEIASRLPAYLPPIRPKQSSSSPSPAKRPPADIPPVRILTPPEAVRVSYSRVRSLVPKLWGDVDEESPSPGSGSGGGGKEEDVKKKKKKREIHVMLHIGMASPRPHYSLERRGHRDGYCMRDVDGFVLNDEERRAREGDRWVWAGCPEELETDLRIGDVLERWKGYSPDHADLRISEDAGHYLCDFIYYSSLAHLWTRRERRRALFLHVPADLSEDAVALGRELVLQLIRAVVESEVARGREEEMGERDEKEKAEGQ